VCAAVFSFDPWPLHLTPPAKRVRCIIEAASNRRRTTDDAKTFYFFSYEGLRHVQGVDLNAGVLTEAQRAAVTDPMSQRLLPYIPLGNTVDPNGQASPSPAAG
jgi:hypothetical protein